MSYARDVYEEGALIFPCVRIQRDYEDVRGHRAHVPRADPRAGDVVRRLPRRARRGRGSASGGSQELAARYGLETLEQFVEEWLDYSERRMTEAIRELPTRPLRVRGRHDPLDGHPDGIPVRVGRRDRPDEAGRVTVDLRDNDDCLALGLNLSEACARAGALIAIYNCLPDDVPHNAGSFRRVDVLIREGSLAGGLTPPHSASVSTTNVLNRLINAIQAGFAAARAGPRARRGRGSVRAGLRGLLRHRPAHAASRTSTSS